MHSYIPPSNQMVYINEYSVYSSHMQKKHTAEVHSKKDERGTGDLEEAQILAFVTRALRWSKLALVQRKVWGVIQKETW